MKSFKTPRGGEGLGDNFGTGVRVNLLKPAPIIYPAFKKNPAYSYTWFHRKLTYSYSVLWTYIPIYILCDCVCERATRVILVRVCESVFWRQPQSYTWPLKINSLFIYLISQTVDLFIYCSLNLYTILYPLWFVNKLTNDPHHEKTFFMFTCGRWKRGLFGTHIRTVSYCHISPMVLNILWCRICWKEDISLLYTVSMYIIQKATVLLCSLA